MIPDELKTRLETKREKRHTLIKWIDGTWITIDQLAYTDLALDRCLSQSLLHARMQKKPKYLDDLVKCRARLKPWHHDFFGVSPALKRACVSANNYELLNAK